VKRKHGIRGLRGYQQGDLVEDSPGWWERLRERVRQGQRESTQPHPSVGTPMVPGLSMRLPLAYRQLTADVLGKQVRERLGMEGLGNLIGSRDITAGDMSSAELSALQDAVLRGMGGNIRDLGPDESSYLEYEDYATSGADQYSDVGGARMLLPESLRGYLDMAKKMVDPSYSMKMTFGQAGIQRGDPKRGEDPNDYYLSDRYNFNPPAGKQPREEPTEFGDFLADMKQRVSTAGMYGYPRAVGQAYGSPEGEGSVARVNLGDLEEALARSRGEERPSRLARGLGWLGGLFDRDGDVEVAETEPIRAPVATQVDELAELRARLQTLQDPRIQ